MAKKKKKKPKPKPRTTMDVDPSWLESEPEAPPPPPALPLDLAPDAPQATGPRRRDTIQVQMEWLEPSDSQPEADAGKSTKRGSARPRKPVIPPLLVATPRGKLPPPLPRSEPPAASRRTSRPPHRKEP